MVFLPLAYHQVNAHEIYFTFMLSDYYNCPWILHSSSLFSVTNFVTPLYTNTVRMAKMFKMATSYIVIGPMRTLDAGFILHK